MKRGGRSGVLLARTVSCKSVEACLLLCWHEKNCVRSRQQPTKAAYETRSRRRIRASLRGLFSRNGLAVECSFVHSCPLPRCHHPHEVFIFISRTLFGCQLGQARLNLGCPSQSFTSSLLLSSVLLRILRRNCEHLSSGFQPALSFRGENCSNLTTFLSFLFLFSTLECAIH